MYDKSPVLFLPLKVRDWLHLVQNYPQGNMNTTFHELTYNDKVNQKSWLDRHSNLHLWVTANLTAALPEFSYRANWEQYPRFIIFKCTSSRISSVKFSWESLAHFNVVSNIKSCRISPLFHCLLHVPKISSRHIFHKAFVSNISFHHLHIVIFCSHIRYEFLLCHIFHRPYVSNTLFHYLSHLVFSVAIFVNVVIYLFFLNRNE